MLIIFPYLLLIIFLETALVILNTLLNLYQLPCPQSSSSFSSNRLLSSGIVSKNVYLRILFTISSVVSCLLSSATSHFVKYSLRLKYSSSIEFFMSVTFAPSPAKFKLSPFQFSRSACNYYCLSLKF